MPTSQVQHRRRFDTTAYSNIYATLGFNAWWVSPCKRTVSLAEQRNNEGFGLLSHNANRRACRLR